MENPEETKEYNIIFLKEDPIHLKNLSGFEFIKYYVIVNWIYKV